MEEKTGVNENSILPTDTGSAWCALGQLGKCFVLCRKSSSEQSVLGEKDKKR